MLCIGHRGARGQRPENTLESIEFAINQGADAIEIDVREHSHHLIVFHDETLERTTNGTGELCSQTLAQLRQLDAGNNQQIPFLDEVITMINRRVPLNIELKDSASAALVISTLEQFITRGWDYNDFVVSSFFHPLLQHIKATQPMIPIGALSAGVMVDYAQFAQQLDAVSINLCSDTIDQAIIDDAHARGLQVFIYTVNDTREFARFYHMGVDGLFTDYPKRLKDWLKMQSKP